MAVTEQTQVDFEFVGGPYDGKVIGVKVDFDKTAAPRIMDLVVNPDPDPEKWPQQIEEGTLVERYRAPAGDEELAQAVVAYAAGAPVKYRYVGQVMS